MRTKLVVLAKIAQDALKLYRYQKGDILYVRETFANIPETAPGNIHYKASATKADLEWFDEEGWKWKPSIHMPKEVARIFLKVTDIRIERVQDITEENAIAEGCKMAGDFPAERKIDDGIYEGWDAAREWFADSWQNLYKSKGYGWDDNPWVWVIEFERCEKQDEN